MPNLVPAPSLATSTAVNNVRPDLNVAPVSSPRLQRRDSIISSLTLDPGSPVANESVSVNQFHGEKEHSPFMENKIASPPKDTHKRLRRDDQDKLQDT